MALAPHRLRWVFRACALLAAFAGFTAERASAELPAAAMLLAELGLTADEIAQVEAGTLVHHAVQPASERELVAGLAFQVPVPPAELAKGIERDLLDRTDPNVNAFGVVSTPASAADFAKLSLEPGAAQRAQAYTSAQAGGDLNLSPDEIAAFGALGGGASPAVVAAQVRASLAARVEAYRAKGLAGIAPYALAGGKLRSPGEELRTASKAMQKLAKYAPAAYQFLLSYPNGKPPGTQEVIRWSQIEAHGTPTFVLTQALLVPDGDAWIAVQRQFYASSGYNAEQAVAAFLPSAGGTVVVYANRTSTDQITGFGGSAKRSIGSKLLASQLEALFERVRKSVK